MKKILWAGHRHEKIVAEMEKLLKELYVDAEVIARPEGLKPHDYLAIMNYAKDQGCDIIALPYDAHLTPEFISGCNIDLIMEMITKTSTDFLTYHKESRHWFSKLSIEHIGWKRVIGIKERVEYEKMITITLDTEVIAE